MNVSTTPPMVRRSWRRWYMIGAFILLLFATPTAYYFFAAWRGEREMADIMRAMDEEDPHWRWPDLIAQLKAPPDESNSALQILKVQGLLKKSFNPGTKFENSRSLIHRNARLADENAELLRTAFSALAPEVLPEARKLKDMPEGRFALQAEENPFMMKVDFVQNTRNIAYLLQLDAALRGHDGHMEEAAESCQALLNVPRALKDQPFLISLLVRIAEQHIAVNAIERLLGQGPVSEANLKKLQDVLEREADDDGLHRAMRGERAGGHQMYSSVRDGKTNLSDLFNPMSGKRGFNEQMLDLFPGFILSGYPEYLRLMNEQVHISKLKDVERQEAFHKLDQEVRTKRNSLIWMIMPASTKVAEASQRSQAILRCAIVTVAAERYRLKNADSWPRGLDDLVKAGLLKEIFMDPYDGKPLRWKVTRTGVLVYSVGPDQTDNGGKLDRDRPTTPGTDMGFELWNPKEFRGVPPPAEEEAPK